MDAQDNKTVLIPMGNSKEDPPSCRKDIKA